MTTTTDLGLSPLCLGTNILGWTADQPQSFAVLDAFVAAGQTTLDTADVYSAWVDGHRGGESETVIGAWIASRRNRDAVVIGTKVGNLGGLTAGNVARCLEDSLRRLQTDYVDLYYLHRDVADAPLEETLGAVDAAVRAGKVRHVGLSNFSADRTREAVAICKREGLSPIRAVSPQYNLLEREYEDDLAGVCAEHGIVCLPYYGLASGFLTGKYRPGTDPGSQRGSRLDGSRYVTEHGLRVLDAVEEVAGAHGVPPAAVALAWLRDQPTVASPIASARTPEQLADLVPMVDLVLSDDERSRLGHA
jgi:aryl-alcohol dehydrogenase-like predicted oxidoreductase